MNYGLDSFNGIGSQRRNYPMNLMEGSGRMREGHFSKTISNTTASKFGFEGSRYFKYEEPGHGKNLSMQVYL